MSNHPPHAAHEAHHHYLVPFLLILGYAIVEVLGGWWTGSLALLSDAGHMFSDVAALGLAWVGAVISRRPNPARHASGISYAELIVSVINAVTMLVVIVFIVVEALERFKVPQAVQGFEVMVIAIIGLVVNLIVAKQLHHQAHHHGDSLNNRAAFLHVMGDVLGSVAAIAAGLVIYLTGWVLIDPILSLLISVLLLAFTLKLGRDIWYAFHSGHAPHPHDH
jgi:cobalt-zinc-cadmium efflux system protein